MLHQEEQTMKDLNTPTFYGVGFIGDGPYKVTEKGLRTKAYTAWGSMLLRCYDEKFHLTNPTYAICSVDPAWFNYQNFAEWFYKKYQDGYQLDKDILLKGNKVYSEKNCCLVPKFINCILSARGNDRGTLPIGIIYHKAAKKFVAQINIRGARKHLGSYNTVFEAFASYKTAKEVYIKAVAKEYKNNLEKNVYEALLKYQVDYED